MNASFVRAPQGRTTEGSNYSFKTERLKGNNYTRNYDENLEQVKSARLEG